MLGSLVLDGTRPVGREGEGLFATDPSKDPDPDSAGRLRHGFLPGPRVPLTGFEPATCPAAGVTDGSGYSARLSYRGRVGPAVRATGPGPDGGGGGAVRRAVRPSAGPWPLPPSGTP